MNNSNLWFCPAIVTSVNTKDRLIDVKFLGTVRGATNVLLINDYGSNSSPSIGDGVLVASINNKNFCIGKLPQAFNDQINNNHKDVNSNKILAKEVDEGATSVSNGRTTTSLYLPNSGNFYLTNGNKDGLAHTKKYRMTELFGNIVNLSCLGDSVIQRIGSVIRTIASVPTIISNASSPAKEIAFEIYNQVTNLIKYTFIRFKLGHVIDSNGLPEYSSSGGELRTLLEVNNELGVNKATVTIDEDGNVEIKSSLGIIALDAKAISGILLSGLTSQYSAVLGEKLMTMYKAHTHPSPMGTTGTPTPNPTLDDNSVVLSNQVKLN